MRPRFAVLFAMMPTAAVPVFVGGCGSRAAPAIVYGNAVAEYIQSLERRRGEILGETSVRGTQYTQSRDWIESALLVKSGTVRTAARQSLVGMGRVGIEDIIQYIDTEEIGTSARAGAAGLLALYKHSFGFTLPAAVKAAADLATRAKEPAVRAAAAAAVGELGERSAIPELTLRLRYETSTEVCAALAVALCRLGALAGVGGLRELIHRGELEPCIVSIKFILANEGIAIAEDAEMEQFDAALAVAQRRWFETGRVSSEPLVNDPSLEIAMARVVARIGGADLRAVDDARFILSMSGAAGVPALIVALHDASVYMRVRAMEVLGILGPVARAATPVLLTMTGDPEHPAEVLVALGRIGAPEARPVLYQFADDPRIEVRVAAARGLAARPEVSMAPRLREFLTRSLPDGAAPSPDAALLCIQALIMIPETDAFAVADSLLQMEPFAAHADPAVLERALDAALARCGIADESASKPADTNEKWKRLRAATAVHHKK
ncbi:MAG: HEAT repeat domain-containing protein [Planctomycetes bacterium]|nr:HEAT repeat domain-containing protein [Planctomycetota bacterium]